MSPRGVVPRYGRPGGFGLFGPIPRDIQILVAVQFVTFLLGLIPATRLVPALLELSPAVLIGFVWQLVTYPFVGYSSGIFIVLELLGVLLIAPQIYYGLGRRHFWRMTIGGAVVSGVVAILVYFLMTRVGGWVGPEPFFLMQGQRVLLMMLIAAFSFANPEAEFLFFFILPIKARWFLPLTFAISLIIFLQSHDTGGFAGLCAATAFTYAYRQAGGGNWGRWGKRELRETRLRLERWWIQKKLDRMKKKRGFRVIQGENKPGGPKGDVKRGPWVH
jgi:hypothetical protein